MGWSRGGSATPAAGSTDDSEPAFGVQLDVGALGGNVYFATLTGISRELRATVAAVARDTGL